MDISTLIFSSGRPQLSADEHKIPEESHLNMQFKKGIN